jgi:hypothetical protein
MTKRYVFDSSSSPMVAVVGRPRRFPDRRVIGWPFMYPNVSQNALKFVEKVLYMCLECGARSTRLARCW